MSRPDTNDCRACNYGRHVCRGCGASIEHGEYACAACTTRRTPEQVILSTLIGSPNRDRQHWGLLTAEIVFELEKAGYGIVPADVARTAP